MKLNKKELSGSEALFGFCGWLTTRKQKTVMGSKYDCAPIVKSIAEFCKFNNLAEPRRGWEKNLKHPK